MTEGLIEVANSLVARGKGILAADETPGTLTRRFEALGIGSTLESRRTYREILFTAPHEPDYISGVILQDETIRQRSVSGVPFPELLSERGVTPGIKVDAGAKPLAGWPGETVTEGLDQLRERLETYRGLGARFAKWRATFRVDEARPTAACLAANAHALARYASLCQEQDLVPIVEPEVLMDGEHDLARCEAVTERVHEAVFAALTEQGVALEGMLLKPNMVVPGHDCVELASVGDVAEATLRCLRQHVPAAVPGVVFLSGGQSAELATAHLDAINRAAGPKPWALTFSYGRALQDPALHAWAGEDANRSAAAEALRHRAGCNSAASRGAYAAEMEERSFAPVRAGFERDHDD